MSYQVIARKYRPQKFSDVVGQEHVTRTLMNAVSTGRIAHAYLFCGPRGTGKTTLARIFAKALNCTGGPKGEWDEEDSRVREIREGRSLDVLEIDGASNNGVEQVRELRETVRFAPASSRFKIYIIDEVHMLTTAAFNALLKTLEEPPAHVKFLFATTDPEKVLPTILSRCQRFDLRRIPSALITKHLAWIAKQEGVEIEDAALQAIARGADGGMRDAESALDQLISFCGNRVVEGDVLSMFGLAGRAQIRGLCESVMDADSNRALRLVDELSRSGAELGRVLGEVAEHFRNLMVYQVSRGDESLIEAGEDERAHLREQNGRLEVSTLTRLMNLFTSAESRQRDAVSKRIFLELTFVQAVEARNAVSLDVVLQQLRDLRSGALAGAGALPAAAAPAPVPARASVSAATAPAPAAALPTVTPKPVERAVLEPAAGGAGLALSGGGREWENRGAADSGVGLGTRGAGGAAAAGAGVAASSGERASPLRESERPKAGGAGGETEAVDAGSAEGIWSRLLEGVGAVERASLQEGWPVGWEKGILTVGFPPGCDVYDFVTTKENTAKLLGKIREFSGAVSGLRWVQGAGLGRVGTAGLGASRGGGAGESGKAGGPGGEVSAAKAAAGGGGAAAAAGVGGVAKGGKASERVPAKVAPVVLDKAEFLNDPLIRDALEVFKARVVEVRAPGGGGEAGGG